MTVILVFSTAQTAERTALGIPAQARRLREARQIGLESYCVNVPCDWPPSPDPALEVERLASGLVVNHCELAPIPEAQIIAGEKLLGVPEQVDRLAKNGRSLTALQQALGQSPGEEALHSGIANDWLDRQSGESLAATGKPNEGIVSRYINRPISRRTTRVPLVKFGPFPLSRAIGATALISITVAPAFLLLHGQFGLPLGALLFQAVSTFDVVNGEIARAKFHTSHLGASFDSLVDAAPNIMFFAGVILDHFNWGKPPPLDVPWPECAG